MRIDIRDCEFTSTQRAGTGTAWITAKHLPTGVTVEMAGTLCGDDKLRMVEYLRERIKQRVEPGEPDKMVVVTADGVARILGAVEGSVYVVHSETPSPRGQIMHVTDSAGNVWSLGPGQYELFSGVPQLYA